MYHTTMKHLLISIYILVSFLFMNNLASVYAQEEEVTGDSQTVIQEYDEEDIDNQETKTLDEALQEDTPASIELNFFQILVAILAPLTFLTIGYLLIKKLKL